MREIEFRGKSKFKNTWVYGKLLNHKRIITQSDDETEEMPCFDMCDYQEEVYENTIGQYTGLKDKNGNKIFEGDIILVSQIAPAKVFYNEENACYAFDYGKNGRPFAIDLTTDTSLEVIGNIYDNKDLIGE